MFSTPFLLLFNVLVLTVLIVSVISFTILISVVTLFVFLYWWVFMLSLLTVLMSTECYYFSYVDDCWWVLLSCCCRIELVCCCWSIEKSKLCNSKLWPNELEWLRNLWFYVQVDKRQWLKFKMILNSSVKCDAIQGNV